MGIGRLLFGFGRSSHILPPPKAGSLLGTHSETLADSLINRGLFSHACATIMHAQRLYSDCNSDPLYCCAPPTAVPHPLHTHTQHCALLQSILKLMLQLAPLTRIFSACWTVSVCWTFSWWSGSDHFSYPLMMTKWITSKHTCTTQHMKCSCTHCTLSPGHTLSL